MSKFKRIGDSIWLDADATYTNRLHYSIHPDHLSFDWWKEGEVKDEKKFRLGDYFLGPLGKNEPCCRDGWECNEWESGECKGKQYPTEIRLALPLQPQPMKEERKMTDSKDNTPIDGEGLTEAEIKAIEHEMNNSKYPLLTKSNILFGYSLAKKMKTDTPIEAIEFVKWLDKQRDEQSDIWNDTDIWGEYGAFEKCLEIFKTQNYASK